MSGWIALELDRTAWNAGEEVTGRFAAKWRQSAVTARIGLDYVETTRMGTVVRVRGPRVERPAGPFAIALPPDAPPTLEVRHANTVLATVTWRVEVRIARFGPDDTAWESLTVTRPA